MGLMLDVYKAVGGRVRSVRQSMGLTQKALGHKAFLSRTSIANIEAGTQRIQLDTLYRVAEALRVSPSDLLPEPADLRAGADPTSALPDDEQHLVATMRRVLEEGDQ
jgi:transcriptional regulator with XRE-family HTH domain